MKEELKITGHIKRTVIRADGSIEIWEETNTIQTEFKNIIAAHMETGTTFELDNLFAHNNALSTPGDDISSGIVIKHSDGTWYAMDCVNPAGSGVSGSGNNRKMTAEFTGTGITISDSASVVFGRNHSTTLGDFITDFAKPTSWSSLTLTAVDTLKIEWTITIN